MTGSGADDGAGSFSGASLPRPLIPGDDGTSTEELRRALTQLAAGRGSAADVLAALATSRLFVPVVAVLEESETGADGVRREKTSSMATVLVESREHGRAQLAFGSVESLTAWRADARPVAVTAPDAARAAVDEGADALLVDVRGPVAFALTGAELLLMASLADRSPFGEDPVVARAVTAVVRQVVPSARARVDPPRDGAGSPPVLIVDGVDDEQLRTEVVQTLSRDRVVTRLLPDGLRVTFGETPQRPGGHPCTSPPSLPRSAHD
jgi:hypothetical protein